MRGVYRTVGMMSWALVLPGCFGLLSAPESKTAAEATGREAACNVEGELSPRLRPMVVDMDAMDRVDLEVAMGDGLVVVRHDCNGMEVLRDCRVEADYGFIGVQKKEEVVRLDSQDELRANLPISAGTMGANLGGNFDQQSTLDIALMMIGKKRSTKQVVARAELVENRPGACDGATHFVRGATVGAFAMTTGTKAETRAAAEIFGIPNLGKVGVGGGSKRSKDVSKKDGDLKSCDEATPDHDKPPSQCGALLHLELALITEAAAPDAGGDGLDDMLAVACPKDHVYAAGKCTRTTDKPYLCKPKAYEDCQKQCDAGNAGSCSRVAYYTLKGEHFAKSTDKALTLFQKACDGGFTLGCATLGSLYILGEDVPKDTDRGVALVQQACDAGDAKFCTFLGGASYVGNMVPKDVDKAARLARRGCYGGSANGCFLLGETYRKGVGGNPKDEAKARELYRRGCVGKDGVSCYAYAVALQDGIGGAKDDAKARAIFQDICKQGMKKACEEI